MSVREITTAICNRGQLLFCRNALWHHRGQRDVGDRAELQGYQVAEGKKACQEPMVGTPQSLVTFSLLAPRLLWARQAQRWGNIWGLEARARHRAPPGYLQEPAGLRELLHHQFLSRSPNSASVPAANSLLQLGGKERGSLLLARFSSTSHGWNNLDAGLLPTLTVRVARSHSENLGTC